MEASMMPSSAGRILTGIGVSVHRILTKLSCSVLLCRSTRRFVSNHRGIQSQGTLSAMTMSEEFRALNSSLIVIAESVPCD